MGESILNYPGGPNLITWVFKSTESSQLWSGAAVMTEGSERCDAASSEDGGKGHR